MEENSDPKAFTNKPPVVPSVGSAVFGVSLRAWLALILVITVCVTHVSICTAVLVEAVINRDFAKVGTFTTIGEPLYSMSVAALGFYFGQKK